jgi:uncharacterized protein YgiB involved in biofilm formation
MKRRIYRGNPIMKRSRSVKLVAMGAGLFLVAGCEESQVDAALYNTPSQCILDGFSKEECSTSFESAKAMHVDVAPKYTSLVDCEADFGAKECETAPQVTQAGGSVFMPLMAGYMMGRMMSGGAQPLYRSRDDRASFRTADNRNVGSSVGRTQVARSATQTPAAKTRTVSRGGFGASARRSVAG